MVAASIDRIFTWTRMQTYYVQLICNKLYGKTGNINDAMIDEILEEIIQQEIPLFSSYQQLLTRYQWKLLTAIAREERTVSPYSQAFISKYDLGAASSVKTGLDTLITKEIVIRDSHEYTLQDTLLMRWLQQL